MKTILFPNDAISVIIPTYNEAPNIHNLIIRLHETFNKSGLTYELIFVDDNSTDNTKQEINSYLNLYPIYLHSKVGKKGKAFSLLQGFSLARYRYVAMIDADLQYPPEAIPEMLKMVSHEHSCIVVANRVLHKTTWLRQVASNLNRIIFCKFMWGLEHDVQSGLKVFEKAILESITINPSPWTFDLEFLIKARSNGAQILGFDIEFAAREAGETKINILFSSPQIILSSIKLKLASYKNLSVKQKTLLANGGKND